VSGNSAGDYGGGLYQCNGTIQNNIITANCAGNNGGGLYYCNGTVCNCIISGNSAGQGGGGLYGFSGPVGNCTITGNSAKYGAGGGLYGWSGAVVNCMIWGNRARQYPQLFVSTPTYSCIQDWAAGGQGNIADLPRFVRSGYWDDPGTPYDPGDDVWVEGDYHLLPGAACIDAGKNEDWMWDAVDLDGSSRIFPGASPWRVDIGAYEYVPLSYTFRQFARKTADGFQIVWTSESGRAYTILSCVDLSTGLWGDEETVPCQGVTTRWTDTRPAGRMKFYRIRVE
jgi:hypothetical protein